MEILSMCLFKGFQGINKTNILAFVRLNCLFPLYQVIIAFGLEPMLSQITSYLRSATNGVGGFIISTVRGFTEKRVFINKLQYLGQIFRIA